MWALSLTDHGTMAGVLDHMKVCQKIGIQPLVGCEVYYRPDRSVRGAEWQYRKWHLILIAQNVVGWHNLLRLSSAAYKPDAFYRYPCVDDELLDLYSDGIHCTTACVLGPLAHLIGNGTSAQIESWVDRTATRYKGRFSIEIQPHGFELQQSMNKELVYWAQNKGLPISVGGDAHYAQEGWVDTQKVAILIGTNTTFEESDEKTQKRADEGLDPYELWHDGLHLLSEDEVRAGFAEHHSGIPQSIVDEAISNNEAIAQSCLPFMVDRSLKMPRATSSPNESERIVKEWCREGMDRIGVSGDPVYEDQLEHELQVMRDKKVAFDYAYITGDILRWARSDDPLPAISEDPFPVRKRPIRFSCRGSGCASLVNYCCKITGINPIRHKLKFERFLNPGRKGLPDIDVDFPDTKTEVVDGVLVGGRDLVKEYVARKFGRDCVADIVAMSRFTPRAALSNVARIMGIDYTETKKVTDQMDPVHDEDLDVMRGLMPDLNTWANKYPDAFTHAMRLENHADPFCLRLSKHAAGVIITPGPVNDYMPTVRASEDDPIARTAWSETPRLSIVDDFGFCKWDFLSITGMTQQDKIVALVEERTGERIDLDQLPVCFDPTDVDQEVMDVFRSGLTLGVWQFEGASITSFMKGAVPKDVIDLSAISAVYRPGPMGAGGHNRYAKRARGEDEYVIPEPLVSTLSDTYGQLVFQEQVMEVFQVLVGYSAGQADDVRKEIDKLNRGKSGEGRVRLAARKEEFIEKASEKIGGDAASSLWEEILPYTGYS